MPIPLGILAVAGAGGGALANSFDLLETTTIASGNTSSSITFSNLNTYSDYKHLQIRATIRTNRSGNQDDLMMVRFNGDTGTNYAGHAIYGNGSTIASFSQASQTYIRSIYVNGADAATNSYMGMVLDLLDYSNTSKNKTIRALHGTHNYNWISLASGFWNNTAAITSITFNMVLTATSFVAGTRFSLYGIK